MDETTRLNKYLALRLGIARREADELIEQDKVTVNQLTARLGTRVKADDEVRVDGKLLATPRQLEYLLLHKPVGYVCSRRAQGETPTIYELIPEKYHHLKPVGRLDKDSSGILLLTNDGDFAFTMTHPQFQKVKVYEVTLDHALAPLHQQMISDFGVMLPDGKSQLELERLTDSRLDWRITMKEGRNRQIRRTFGALGYTVTMLHRTHFGRYQLGDLASGEFRLLEDTPASTQR
ncbi:pseudouridine synthase [Candidatus Saccharibacteria bacterium RAAC3_TM7_1]|nr:pseudouridine synthase [Candidatus Saccharibacteria bacterium RAAC3_TM7_1]HCZ28359.1 rRNA pseudouridine synthase [Candidatus Saccharibacteria bacterium]